MSARDLERLRQERESFDLNKGQHSGWFRVQMVTICVVLALLVGVAIMCAFIILNAVQFTAVAVGAAAAALFGDIVTLGVILVRLVLSPQKRPSLEPICPVPRAKVSRSRVRPAP